MELILALNTSINILYSLAADINTMFRQCLFWAGTLKKRCGDDQGEGITYVLRF
jgi:hypothetical protein